MLTITQACPRGSGDLLLHLRFLGGFFRDRTFCKQRLLSTVCLLALSEHGQGFGHHRIRLLQGCLGVDQTRLGSRDSGFLLSAVQAGKYLPGFYPVAVIGVELNECRADFESDLRQHACLHGPETEHHNGHVQKWVGHFHGNRTHEKKNGGRGSDAPESHHDDGLSEQPLFHEHRLQDGIDAGAVKPPNCRTTSRSPSFTRSKARPLSDQRTAKLRNAFTATAELSECDILTLAQFSMAPVANRVREQTGMRVSTSPGTAVEKLMRIFSHE